MSIKIFGPRDEAVYQQLERCVAVEEGARGVLNADSHLGYSQPIGGQVAYREHVSPSGVGYDIGCGNMAVSTSLRYEEVKDDLPRIADEIFANISFGMGRKNNEPVDHQVLDQIRDAEFEPQRALRDLAAKQLGTVGAGNHYVDLFRDNNGFIWVGVHFGSRGFGHKTASGFLALAEGLPFHASHSRRRAQSPPVVFHTDTYLAQAYIAAMRLAGAYAHAGREVVVARVLEILGAKANLTVHNHHNYAWQEAHDDELWWVVRKGCTPAFPGQTGFVGASMGGTSVILKGEDTPAARDAMFSTVHGAGRAMSRRQAAGKKRKRWACLNRDCNWAQLPETHKPEDGHCPECDHPKIAKRWVQEEDGLIDWNLARLELVADGIHLRGGAADEAPGAYKNLEEVLAYQGDTVTVQHRLHPIVVCMADPHTVDPFKD